MKRLLLLSLIVLGCSGQGMLVNPYRFAGGGGGGASYTLIYNSMTSGASTRNNGDSDFRRFTGLSHFNDATPRAIGKVTFKLDKAGTDISGFTYVARIWTMTGGTDLNVQQAASAGVAGNNAWSATEVEFTFASPFTTTASTDYAITIDRAGTDAANYVLIYYVAISGGGAPAVPPGYLADWWNTKNFPNEGPTLVPQVKIYTSP